MQDAKRPTHLTLYKVKALGFNTIDVTLTFLPEGDELGSVEVNTLANTLGRGIGHRDESHPTVLHEEAQAVTVLASNNLIAADSGDFFSSEVTGGLNGPLASILAKGSKNVCHNCCVLNVNG